MSSGASHGFKLGVGAVLALALSGCQPDLQVALASGDERLPSPSFTVRDPAAPTERPVCTGPISYIGHEEVKQDLEFFRAALVESGVKPEETFMCVLAPGWLVPGTGASGPVPGASAPGMPAPGMPVPGVVSAGWPGPGTGAWPVPVPVPVLPEPGAGAERRPVTVPVTVETR